MPAPLGGRPTIVGVVTAWSQELYESSGTVIVTAIVHRGRVLTWDY